MIATLDILKQHQFRLGINLFGNEKQCLPGTGYVDEFGYCHIQFRHNKEKYIIGGHRASYMLFHDIQLLPTDIIMHLCDNPICINPNHLKKGSHNDNVQDRVNKGRSATGKNNGRYVEGKYCK